jgi:hypothetical protein
MRNTFFKNFKQKFLKAPIAHKWLFAYALFWALRTRFSMVFLSFKAYRNTLGKLQVVAEQQINEQVLADALLIKTIVLTVCNYTPWESKCLVQAVVCKRMLQKRGIQTTIYLGVANDKEANKLLAHAWLKLGDQILTGSKGHQKFKVVNFYG